jgi:hypothetical protein
VARRHGREWHAELAAMHHESPLKRLRFALSLAFSPLDLDPVSPPDPDPVSPPDPDPVSPPDPDPVSRLDLGPVPRIEAWARSQAGAAGVTLLAAALVNTAHVVQHRAGLAAAAIIWLTAAFLVARIARHSRAPVVARTLAVGAALFGSLLAGNRVAVMPFMGWRDVLPAVLTWTFLTTLLAYAVSHVPRRASALFLAVLGGALTLDLAAIAGSLRAATSLGLALTSAPSWFPLAMLPGGTVTFGAPVAVVGLPDFHSSEMLLANASAMVGPMLLCTVFVLTRALGSPKSGESSVRTLKFFGMRFDSRTVWGVGGAIAALAAAEAFRRTPPGSFEATWHRLLDNSAVFGFGFLSDTPGRVVTALVAGLIATHLGVTRRTLPR